MRSTALKVASAHLANHPIAALHPHQPLIVSRRGGANLLNAKRRTIGAGRKEYKAADALQTHVNHLYHRAGFMNGSTHSGLYASA